VNILKKKKFWTSLQKTLVPRMLTAQSPQKCSNFEILAKIEGKEAKFFRKFTKGI
jgi:hypothetical protein